MPTIRLSTTIAGAVLALGTALLGAGLMVSTPVAAAPVAGATYTGISAKLDALTVSVNAAGNAVQTFQINYPATSVLPGCSNGGSFNAATAVFTIPIVNSSFDTGSLQGPAEYVWFKGAFGDDGLVTGEFRAGPTGNAACTGRDMQWVAVTRPGTAAPASGATFTGSTNTNGTVSFTTAANGQGMTNFVLTLPQSCASQSMPGTLTITDGIASWFGTNTAGATTARFRMGVSGTQASGAYAVDLGVASCPPLIGTFTARAGGTATATPTASATATPATTATPAPGAGSGAIVSGTVPASGGFGLIVYGGGTVAQLVTATKCPTASMALYIAQGGDFLTYVPGTSIGAVNQAFLAAFPNGTVPANTPLIGRCV